MVWMGAPRRGAASACCLLQPASVASCRKMLTRTAAAFLKERFPPCRGMPRCAVRPCPADFGIFLQGASAREKALQEGPPPSLPTVGGLRGRGRDGMS